MNPIKTILVEDEPPARMKLASFVERCPDLLLEYMFADGKSALEYLQNVKDCIVFLDIQMENFTGIQLLENLVNPPKIIITSAFEEYALKGFEYNVCDYLLKPYSFDRFRKAVDKALKEIELERLRHQNMDSFILIKSEYKLERINTRNIIFIEGMKDYLRIHTDTQKIMTLMSFVALEKELPMSHFVRIHKSYMVALHRINAIEKDWIMVEGHRLPLGKSYKERFNERVRRIDGF